MSLDCLDRENLCNGNKKMTSAFVQSKKKSIIGIGKRSTPALALQWLFYLVRRTDQYYQN